MNFPYSEKLLSIKEYVSSLLMKNFGKEKSELMIYCEPGDYPFLQSEFVKRLLFNVAKIVASLSVSYYFISLMVEHLDPTVKEKKKALKKAKSVMKRIGLQSCEKLTEYELCLAVDLIDPSTIETSWADVGGLDDVIKEINDTVIMPFKRRDLIAKSSLIQPPKGMLLHGPPGCGKTLIAKAMAKESGARFLNLQASSLFDKWYGESQKRAEAVFTLAFKIQPVIIFIDEIDALMRNRSSTDHESTAMMKTQFMSLWDGLMSDPTSSIMIVGATNRPGDVDAAIIRRMPSSFHVGLPVGRQRENILKIILKNQEMEELDYGELIARTEHFSGSDLREMCRQAAISTVLDIQDKTNEELRPMVMADLCSAAAKIKKGKQQSLFSRNIELD